MERVLMFLLVACAFAFASTHVVTGDGTAESASETRARDRAYNDAESDARRQCNGRLYDVKSLGISCRSVGPNATECTAQVVGMCVER